MAARVLPCIAVVHLPCAQRDCRTVMPHVALCAAAALRFGA
jgi:hypothetical protein